MNPLLPRRYSLMLLFGWVLLIWGCNPDPVNPPLPSEITKADREKLGDRLADRLLQTYPLLPASPAHDSVRTFVQQLYNQATRFLHLDVNSPPENRWDSEREWTVHILDRPQRREAFVLPGGDLFISTGFLQSIVREHELYYLLTFEATLMNERYLLNQLIDAYSTFDLQRLISGMPAASGKTLDEVGSELPQFVYPTTSVRQIDEAVVEEICRSSLYARDGIASILLAETGGEEQWLDTRLSYGNRATQAPQLPVSEPWNCGDLRTNGAYQKYVRDPMGW